MKFNIYYFENYSEDTPFNLSNPRYVLSLDGVTEVLSTLIKKEAFTLKIENFENIDLVKQLLYIDVLKNKKGTLALKIPFFVEKDVETLKILTKKVAQRISQKLFNHREIINDIVSKVNNGFSNKRNLYHLLCGLVFDGYMFDFLEKQELVTTSSVHASGLDYLVIIYEDCEKLNTYSNQLLCSFNRYNGFVSFGDSQGNRKDFYRYMRLKELNLLSDTENGYVNFNFEELHESFIALIDGKDISVEHKKILEFFDYYKNGKIKVPVYDQKAKMIAYDLYQYVLSLIKDDLIYTLHEINTSTNLTAIQHEVLIKDISNEIYHLIFGEVNELLIEYGLVSSPSFIDGEGRYFKCFEL